jgi:hypothetical protein
MEFRWVALISVWTILSGPVLTRPSAPAWQAEQPVVVVSPPSKTTAAPLPER